MNRKQLDSLVSYVGLALAAVLVVAGSLAMWASSFANEHVTTQLTEQQIFFPEGDKVPVADKDGFTAEDASAIAQYAGQQLTNGDQAYAYAQHYIRVHMNGIGGGKTYGQISGEYMAALATNPTAPETAALGQKRMTLFMGDTLRGLLLNAYAFGTIAKIAIYAAYAAFAGAALLLVLAVFGFRHAKKLATE
ncbi:MAG: hypothetical protein RL410_1056 [Actinomycetota bacterium]|jgi:hypothetical protein